MTEPFLITVVCTANICRSPMAGALLAHALDAEAPPLNAIRVETAGVAAGSGEPATSHSASAVAKVGLDLDKHRSQPLTAELAERSHLILGMTRSHLVAIRQMFPRLKTPVFLFREFLESKEVEIPDPYGSRLEFYEASRDSMVEAIPGLLAFLRKNHSGLFTRQFK